MSIFDQLPPVKFRDEGNPEEKYENGIVSKAAREAWPRDDYLLVKPRITSGDLNFVQRGQVRTQISSRNGDANPEVDASVEVYFTPILWGAALVVGFEGPDFEDPATRQDGVPGTGRPMKMPVDTKARFDLISNLPIPWLSAFDEYVAEEMKKNPLSPPKGTKPPKARS